MDLTLLYECIDLALYLNSSMARQTATAMGCAENEMHRLPENALGAVGEGKATHEDDIRQLSQL